eukprot:snap_masked-scaffold_6-processed-gene-20.13-mRNA-1 protein AED:0.91 eAED:1.00 QI:0/0/0/0.5/1/1/2/0/124
MFKDTERWLYISRFLSSSSKQIYECPSNADLSLGAECAVSSDLDDSSDFIIFSFQQRVAPRDKAQILRDIALYICYHKNGFSKSSHLTTYRFKLGSLRIFEDSSKNSRFKIKRPMAQIWFNFQR